MTYPHPMDDKTGFEATDAEMGIHAATSETDVARKIVTDYWRKPGPTDKFDWSATFDDYDADCDGDGFFSNDPDGYGATEQEAIDDLLSQAEDQP